MHRRAQLLGQIFMFVIGLFVVAAIMYFGATVLDNMNEERCNVREVKFGTTMSTYFDRFKEFGAGQVIRVETPCDAVGVCFVDRDYLDERMEDGPGESDLELNFVDHGADDQQRQTIRNSFHNLDPANVFILYADRTAESAQGFSEVGAPVTVRYNTGERALCLPAHNEVVEVRLDGTGTRVKVSEP